MSEEEKAELQEANDDIVWWSNRFNAVQRDYEELKTKIDRAIEYIKEHTDKLKTTRVPKIDFNYNEVLEILGDKENE